MITQAEKAETFRKLHEKGSCFVIPNPWDLGSARLLEHLGFKALASSSAGFAFSIAKSDLTISKASLMTHLTGVCQVTAIPVSAGLQERLWQRPGETWRSPSCRPPRSASSAARLRITSGDGGSPIYPLELAAERIRQAAVAARSSGIQVHPDGTRRESSLRTSGYPRYHPAPAGLPGGRCRCAVRAGDQIQRGHPAHRQRHRSALECSRRPPRHAAHGSGPAGTGRHAHQSRRNTGREPRTTRCFGP